MRLVRIGKQDGVVTLANADLITVIRIGPHPETDKLTEVTIEFGGDYYIECRYTYLSDARQAVANLADMPLGAMIELLS